MTSTPQNDALAKALAQALVPDMHTPYEAIIASEVPEATIASMAHMSNEDIQFQIARIKDMQRSLAYRMSTRNVVQRIDATELHAYGCELIRRRVMADLAPKQSQHKAA